MVVTLGQQYNIGEKPTVIHRLCTYINCHTGIQKHAKIEKYIIKHGSNNILLHNRL